MTDTAAPQPEFSRPFDTAELGEYPEPRVIEASEDERRALAQRFETLGIDRLRAALTITKLSGGLFRVEGRLEAAVRQRCVVTLEPLESTIDERFALTYAATSSEDDIPGAEGEEGPDPLDGSVIDLGEAVSQQLALALDPYPRAPGASLEAVLPQAGQAKEESAGPFAALAALRKRMS